MVNFQKRHLVRQFAIIQYPSCRSKGYLCWH
uniref:Uncharacterized protein n=1 Tax=Arundo donax TaxID=35708 RepID=A0A0A9FXV4_ARUDO